MLKEYLQNLQRSINKGDATEPSLYKHLEKLLKDFAQEAKFKNIDVTVLPKQTDARQPGF